MLNFPCRPTVLQDGRIMAITTGPPGTESREQSLFSDIEGWGGWGGWGCVRVKRSLHLDFAMDQTGLVFAFP